MACMAHRAPMRASLATALVALGCSSEPAKLEPPADAGADVADTHVVGHGEDARRDTASASPPPEVPESLATTGLYSDFASRALAEGVLAYAVRYPLWADGADATRYLLVPAGKKIDTSDMDHWSFPLGTKSWMEVRRAGVLLETRYLEKSGEAPIGWKYVAYAWSADGKSAIAARSGVVDALGTIHDVPSQDQCEQCHSGGRDVLIGVAAIQLSRESGKSPLAELAERGLLSHPPGREFSPPGTGVVKEALGYLHGNCGYCHSDYGRWSELRKLRLRLRVGDTDPANTPTYLTTINVKMSHLDRAGEPFIGIVPGEPEKSHLFIRSYSRDEWSMPPTGTEIANGAGLAVLKEWIESLR